MKALRFKTNLYIKELVMFLAVQLLGLYIALKIISQSMFYDISAQMSFSWSDIISLLVAGIIFAFVIKYGGRFKGSFFKIILILAIFSGSEIFFSSFTHSFIATLLSLAMIVLFLNIRRVWLHNLIIIITLAGVGATFGLSLTPLTTIVLLVVLSFYDIWAVYKTKHMVALAEGMIKANAIFGFVIPVAMKDFLAPVNKIIPGPASMILGSGDIVFPLVLVASVSRVSLIGSFFVIIFAAVGLWITHLLFVNQSERRPMAALPPIAALSVLGYLFFILLV